MLLQVSRNLEEKVQKKDLSTIHSEDLILSASLAALEQQASRMEPEKGKQFTQQLADLNQQVSKLHYAGDTGQERLAEEEFAIVRRSFDSIKGFFPATIVSEARAMGEMWVCPAHADVVGKRDEFCPKCGALLDQQSRILPAFCGLPMPGRNSTRVAVGVNHPLARGESAECSLQLTRSDGSQIFDSDLLYSHGAKIHLLLIDESLTDYHHEHPRPTGPGHYSFSFVPQKPGPYYAWAEVRVQPIGYQEYATTTIPVAGAGEPLKKEGLTTNAVVEGFRYRLILDREPILAGRPVTGRLNVTKLDGTPFRELEPVMESFAHLVGFYDDHKTVLHIHPKGGLVTNQTARGGPELEFQLFAPKPGFIRLFSQTQINGKSEFAPFSLQVRP